MKTTPPAAIHLLKLHQYPIYEQLQLEEALLRADHRNWCLINEGCSDAIVMGISGKPEELVCPHYFLKKPIPLIRRFSGGGTVVVDSQTCFITLICNEACVGISSFPNSILKWNAKLYEAFLSHQGFQLRENDYVLGDRKWGGNAQSITKKRWLHHTSILWDYCPQKMRYLQMPPRMPTYRNERDHEHFLCRLSDTLDSKEQLFTFYLKQLEHHFQLIETPLSEALLRVSHPHRKATSYEEYLSAYYLQS